MGDKDKGKKLEEKWREEHKKARESAEKLGSKKPGETVSVLVGLFRWIFGGGDPDD